MIWVIIVIAILVIGFIGLKRERIEEEKQNKVEELEDRISELEDSSDLGEERNWIDLSEHEQKRKTDIKNK